MGKKKYKVGLVLSGGGARGIAHIGVLKALNEYDIFPEIISATSAGTIIGALYAEGHSPDKILSYFNDIKLLKRLRIKLSSTGIFRNNKMLELLPKYLKAQTFEELNIPLYVSCTDLYSSELYTFHEGPLLKPIEASTAVPIVFNAIPIQDMLLVDGGMLNNMPLEPIQDQCEKIIGVSVNPVVQMDKIDGRTETIERIMNMALWENIRFRINELDLFIEPKELGYYSATALDQRQNFFDIAYEHTKKVLGKMDLGEFRKRHD